MVWDKRGFMSEMYGFPSAIGTIFRNLNARVQVFDLHVDWRKGCGSIFKKTR